MKSVREKVVDLISNWLEERGTSRGKLADQIIALLPKSELASEKEIKIYNQAKQEIRNRVKELK
jgi:hypothetical protein